LVQIKSAEIFIILNSLFQEFKNFVLKDLPKDTLALRNFIFASVCGLSPLDLLKSWHGGVTVIVLSDREYYGRVSGTKRELNSELSSEVRVCCSILSSSFEVNFFSLLLGVFLPCYFSFGFLTSFFPSVLLLPSYNTCSIQNGTGLTSLLNCVSPGRFTSGFSSGQIEYDYIQTEYYYTQPFNNGLSQRKHHKMAFSHLMQDSCEQEVAVMLSPAI